MLPEQLPALQLESAAQIGHINVAPATDPDIDHHSTLPASAGGFNRSDHVGGLHAVAAVQHTRA